MLRTISPNRVGSAHSARAEPGEKFPEGVPGLLSWAPAGCRPDAGLLGGPLFQGWARTIMTSKCRHPETCQEGASLRPITPKKLAGWSHRRSVTSASDTESCVALGQSLSLSEPPRPGFSDGDSSVKIDFKISPETERYIIAMTGPIHQKDKTMIKGRDSPNV